MLTETELEQHFSAILGCRLALSISCQECDMESLTEAERLRLAEIRHELKRKTWLRGRSALKQLLGRLAGEFGSAWVLEQILPSMTLAPPRPEAPETSAGAAAAFDTACLQVPHPRLSLSHSGALAIAAAILEPDARGVGIDIEFLRQVKSGSVRFFLAESEQLILQDLPSESRNRELLRLWTVKEALFKADLENRGRTLIKYLMLDPVLHSGKAVLDFSRTFAEAGKQADSAHSAGLRELFSYGSIVYGSAADGEYWLSLAVASPVGLARL